MRSLVLGLVLASAVWAAWQLDLARYMSVAGMRALVDAHARYGPLVFMAIVVAGLFTRVPMMGTVLVAVGAVLFGRLPAFAYGWLAALVGTTAIFLLGGSRLRAAHAGRPLRVAAGDRRAGRPQRLPDRPRAAAGLWPRTDAQLGARPDRRPPPALCRRHGARHRSEPRGRGVLRRRHREPPARQRHFVAAGCGRRNTGRRSDRDSRRRAPPPQESER